ncbi:MAG: DUF2279 domain-containing protein [Chitinophagaceae bacterium]|nr:DUF2279 domain-containing protein [Chitinophagaceae bacterium]
MMSCVVIHSMRFKILLPLFCLLLRAHPLSAQDTAYAGLRYPDSLNTGRVWAVAGTEAALWAGSMAYLQFVWYKDKKRVPFEFYDDSRGYLQVDKFGHVFGSYLESYIGYHALRCAGVPKRKALWYGGTLGILLQTPIEVWDGMYEDWGFSWSDMAANAAGSALVIGQELLWDEQRIKYKFSFSPSPYAKAANGYLGTGFGQLFNDYNGHTYWLSMGINKIVPNRILPDWLNIAAGYSGNGMIGEFENLKSYYGVPIPPYTRYRQYVLSLDVDWTKIKTRSRFLRTIFQGMFMVKLPFPAIEFNSLGQVKGHWLYY